jgi:hypothetical protein
LPWGRSLAGGIDGCGNGEWLIVDEQSRRVSARQTGMKQTAALAETGLANDAKGAAHVS